MPVATYAISYKDTGSILSFCVLAKQQLTDAASVAALLDRLVDDKLVISLRIGATGFSFSKTDLAVDEITINQTTQSDFSQDPFKYGLVLPDPSSKPGDGKVKTIKEGGFRSLTLHTDGKLTLDLGANLGPTTNVYAALEGHAPITHQLTAPAPGVTFDFATTIAGAKAVLFLGQGLKSSVELIPVT